MRRWRARHGHDRRAAQLGALASHIDSASRSPISSISRSQPQSRSGYPGPTHSGVDFLARGSRRNPDDDPAQCGEFLKTLDVLGELAAVGAVLVTVVLDGDLEVFPAHIQEVCPAASPHPNLSLRLGKARLDNEQPQPGLLRGFRSGVIQDQHSRIWRIPRTPRWRAAMSSMSAQLKDAAAPRASSRATAPHSGGRRARSKAVRAKDVTGMRPRTTVSPLSRPNAEVTMPAGVRAFVQANSTGSMSSTHLAPYNRAAVSPATTPCRPDHNHAPSTRWANVGVRCAAR